MSTNSPAEPQPAGERLDLLTQVILGLPEVEQQCRGLQAFSSPTSVPSSCFGGEAHLDPDGIPCRDFAWKAGLALPAAAGRYDEVWLELTLRGEGVRVGDIEEHLPRPAPLEVSVVDAQRLMRLGQLELSGEPRWQTVRLKLPHGLQLRSRVKVFLDAEASFLGPERHWGIRLHAVRLLYCGALAEPHPTTARPDIALLLAPPWNVDTPPLGLACLTGYLEHHGVAVEAIDLNARLYNRVAPELRQQWSGLQYYDWLDTEEGPRRVAHLMQLCQPELDQLERQAPAMVGLSFYKINHYATLALAAELRRRLPRTTLVAGGPGLYNHPLAELQQQFDYLVFGEGEESLLELWRGDSSSPVIVPCAERKVRRDEALTLMRVVEDLTALPPFELHHFDRTDYVYPYSVPGLTSRGCYNKCIYCLDRKTCVRYRHYGAEQVVRQVERLVQQGGAEFVFFNDLLVNGDIRQLEATCEQLIARGLPTRWSSFASIRKGMTPALLAKVKASGCETLTYGMESACPKVLRAMGKPYGPELITQVLRDTHQAGIHAAINLIFGFPGETWDDFMETVDFVVQHRDIIHSIGSITDTLILPNTDLYASWQAHGVLEVSEDDSRTWRDAHNDPATRLKKCKVALERIQAAGIGVIQPS